MKLTIYTALIFLVALLVAQDGIILPGQKSAIRSLATLDGFSDKTWTHIWFRRTENPLTVSPKPMGRTSSRLSKLGQWQNHSRTAQQWI